MKYLFVIYGRPKYQPLDDLLSEVNKTMKESFGFKERLTYTARLTNTILTTDAALTDEQLEAIRKIIENQISESFADVFVKKGQVTE